MKPRLLSLCLLSLILPAGCSSDHPSTDELREATPAREPVLQLTCDIAIVVLAAIEPATVDTLATALRGRGVDVDHPGKLRAKLLGLADIDDVERDVPPDESAALWTCTDKGRARARAVQAALADLAE